MHRNEVEGFIDSHGEEMIEGICTLCRINNEKMPYVEGKPYGEGPFQAPQATPGMAEGYDFSIRNYDNYVGTTDLNGKRRQLNILAHLDVIPAGKGQTETEPFEPMIENRKLFGYGTADGKGSAVVVFYAMGAVRGLGIPLDRSVKLVLGTDEECGSSNIVNRYDKEDEAPMTFSPGAEFPVINIEKGRLEGRFHTPFQTSETMLRLVKVEAGIKANVVPGKARVVVEGIDLKTLEAAIGAVEKETGISFVPESDLPVITVTAQEEGTRAPTPQEGKNAFTDLLVYLTRLPSTERPRMDMVKNLLKLFSRGDTCGRVVGISTEDELFSTLTLAFSVLTVGANGLEDVFDSQCPICITEESVLGVVKQIIADQGFTLENNSMVPPHHADENSHFVRTLLLIHEDCTGFGGNCQVAGGGTYVRSLKNDVAYDATLPRIDSRMHGANEFVVVNELVLSTKIFAQVIMELCS